MLNQARKYLCYCLSGVQVQTNTNFILHFLPENVVNNLNKNHAGKNSYLLWIWGEAPCRALGSPQLINFLLSTINSHYYIWLHQGWKLLNVILKLTWEERTLQQTSFNFNDPLLSQGLSSYDRPRMILSQVYYYYIVVFPLLLCLKMWQLQHLSIKSAQCSVKWKHNKMHKIQSDLGKSSSDLPLTIKQTSKHAGKH